MTQLFNLYELKQKRSKLRKNQTDAEKKLWQKLRNKQLYGYRFLRQFSIGHFIVDFYCPQKQLVIELDGGQHMSQRVRKYDKYRTKYINSLGMRVLRFWDNDIFENMDGVISNIIQHLNPSLPPLS